MRVLYCVFNGFFFALGWMHQRTLFAVADAQQIVLNHLGTGQRAVMLCGWEGNPRPGRK